MATVHDVEVIVNAAVVVVLGIRIFTNAAAIRRHLFRA